MKLGYRGRIGDSVEVYGYCVQIGRMAGRGQRSGLWIDLVYRIISDISPVFESG